MIGAPGVNIYHNRLRDFTASTTAVNTTSTSTGIHVTYSTSADIVNNFIYFTNPTVQSSIDGIYVESEQSSPVHVYQNTLHNMLICFDLDYSVSTFIKNNICRMGVDTAYGIEVTTDNYDISTLNSNFNLFYNAAAPVRFNDESSGTLTYEDWKTGVYKMDKKSNEADPKLKLNNPTNLKTYLHLKKTSPAINKGKKNITFTKDDVMSAQILLDWDGYTRVKRPDIGADELKVATKKKKK